MIAVTTPTGQIGSQLVRMLLAAKEEVRVIVRDPTKLAAEFQIEVEVTQGPSDDERVMVRALEGAESLFLVVPPSFTTKDTREHYLRFTRPACMAIEKNRVKRVVTVSGLGRGVVMKAGPVSASFAKDKELERTGVDVRVLWCPGFMDNLLRQVESLRQQGAFFFPSRGDLKAPYCATRDIAGSAARLLCDRSWSGQGGLAVLGPEDLSLNDMAAILTDVLGKPIRYEAVPGEAYQARMIELGASQEFARDLMEMFAAKDNGLDNAEPRTAENTTPTGFRQWAEEVLKPAVLN